MVNWQEVVSAVLFEPMVFLQLKIAAVVGFASLLDAMSRSLAPSFRHTLWSAVVVAIVLLPVLERVAPPIPWVSSVVPSESGLAHEGANVWRRAHLADPIAPGFRVESTLAQETGLADSTISADFALPADFGASIHSTAPVDSQVPTDPTAPIDSTLPVDSTARHLLFDAVSAVPWPWIYLVGFLSLAVRRVLAIASVWRVSSRATRVRENAVDVATWRTADTLDLPRIPVVLRSAEIRSAYTWGWFKPRVLVPESSRDWCESRWQAVLLHELSHVRGGDWFRLVLGELVRCVYWFNPTVWIALRRLSVERERACDASVLQHGVKPSEYAAHLLEVARCEQQERRLEAVALSARGGGFEKRIEAILDRDLVIRSSKVLSVLGVGILLSVSTAFAAVSPETDVTRSLPRLSEAMSRSPFFPVPPPAPLPPSARDLGETVPVAPPIPAAPSVSLPGSPSAPVPPLAPISPVSAMAPVQPVGPIPGSEVPAPIAPVPPPPPLPPGPVLAMGHGGHRGYQRTDVQWHSEDGRFRYRDDGISWGLERETEELRLRIRFDSYEDIELNDARNAVVRLGPDSRVLLETHVNGNRHRLTITSDEVGKPSYAWRVGTELRAFDVEARKWKDAVLDAVNTMREVNRLRSAKASLRGRIASIRGQEASMRSRIASARGHVASLRGRMSSVRGHLASRRGHVASMRGEIVSLRAKRRSLRGELSSLKGQNIPDEAKASRGAAIERWMEKLKRQMERLRVETEAYRRQSERADAEAQRRIAQTERELEAFDVENMVKGIEKEIKDFDSAARVKEVERELEKISERDIATLERELPRALERVAKVAGSIQ